MSQDELVCARCAPLEAKVEEMRSALSSMSDENTALGMELAGARQTQITLERQITKLKIDLGQAREDDPKSKEIKGILEYWKVKTGHKRARITLTGERAKLVRGKLRTYKVAELMEAIDGASLLPYMRYGKRYVFSQKPEEEQATQLEHCIGTDRRIDENRAVWHRAQTGAETNPDRLMNACNHHQAIADSYRTLALVMASSKEEDRAQALVVWQQPDMFDTLEEAA